MKFVCDIYNTPGKIIILSANSILNIVIIYKYYFSNRYFVLIIFCLKCVCTLVKTPTEFVLSSDSDIMFIR